MIKQYNAKGYMVRLEITKDLNKDQKRFTELMFYSLTTLLDINTHIQRIAVYLFSNVLAKLTYMMERLVAINSMASPQDKLAELRKLSEFADALNDSNEREYGEEEGGDDN